MEIIAVSLCILGMFIWAFVSNKSNKKEMEEYNNTMVEELEKDLRYHTKIILELLSVLYINNRITYDMRLVNEVFKEVNRAFEAIDVSRELYKGGNVNIINSINLDSIISLEEKADFEKYSSRDEVRIVIAVKSSIATAKELKLKEELGV